MTVFIADANPEYRNYLVNEFEKVNIHVIGTSQIGTNIVDQIITLSPDLVLIELVLPELDGISVLRLLTKTKLSKKPTIIVMSNFINEMLEKQVVELGAQLFIAKPFKICNLLSILEYTPLYSQDILKHIESSNNLIAELLKEMGMPSHIKGFRYSQEAVNFMINSFKDKNYNTKAIYPHVAKIFSTTPSCAERSIRHAIEVAWLRGDVHAHYRFFRNSISYQSGKPTNYEFITTLADKVLTQFPHTFNE